MGTHPRRVAEIPETQHEPKCIIKRKEKDRKGAKNAQTDKWKTKQDPRRERIMEWLESLMSP